MRILAPALTALFLLGLPALAGAGEGCLHGERSASHASHHGKGTEESHGHVCGESCPFAHEGGKPGEAPCPCAGKHTAAHHDEKDPAAGSGGAGTGDEVAVTE